MHKYWRCNYAHCINTAAFELTTAFCPHLVDVFRAVVHSFGRSISGSSSASLYRSAISFALRHFEKINSTMGEMLEKGCWEEPIGRQSLANNSKSFGLLYNQQNIRDQAAAQLTVRSAKEIADRYKDALELPEMERPKL